MRGSPIWEVLLSVCVCMGGEGGRMGTICCVEDQSG